VKRIGAPYLPALVTEIPLSDGAIDERAGGILTDAESQESQESQAVWDRVGVELDHIDGGPLAACESDDAWVAAMKEHPDAAGVTDADGVDTEILVTWCTYAMHSSSRVCVDAEAQGYLK